MRGRVLLFGIDSATLDLMRPWVERGDLPALGALMRTGVFGRLRSVPNMITPAAWTTFATGCNPGKHGIFYFTERIPGSYEERFIKGAARAAPPLWMLLSAGGARTAVVNVPMTYPADPLNGVMVSGMDAPGVDAAGFTYPPELAAELAQRFGTLVGPGTLSGAIGHLVLAGKLDAAREVLERRVKMRTDLARFLMERYPSDLFAVVHTEVDGAQHYFWKYIDQRLPGYSRREAVRYGDSILRVYQKVDRSLATLMEAFGPDHVVVMSDHGAGASPGVSDGVPWIRLVLETLGLAVPLEERDDFRRTSRRAAAALYRRLNPYVPRPLRQAARRWTPGAMKAAKATLKYRYDWSRTRAFCSGAAGDVWINVRGSDPEGTVEPGKEYESLRRMLREEFLALREGDSGEPVVEDVHYREEVYEGPFLYRAPDLIVRFRDVVISSLRMRDKVLRLASRTAAVPKEAKSGSHRPEGVLILNGPGIRQGVELAGAGLADLAPTILYLMDQPVPTYMDGGVLAGAFTSTHLAAHPPRAIDAVLAAGAGREAGYTEEESRLVTERLRNLGYV